MLILGIKSTRFDSALAYKFKVYFRLSPFLFDDEQPASHTLPQHLENRSVLKICRTSQNKHPAAAFCRGGEGVTIAIATGCFPRYVQAKLIRKEKIGRQLAGNGRGFPDATGDGHY